MTLNTNIGPERVQVFDKPLGTVQVPGAGISTAAFIIGTTKSGAPLNAPTSVTDLEQFVDAFGDADEVLYDAYYAVKGYFDNAGTGNTAVIVNVGSSPTPASFIGSAVNKDGLRALDALDEIGMVTIPGLPLEMAYLVQSSLIDYTETVRALFGATLSTSFSLLSIPSEISEANRDITLLTAQLNEITGPGPYVMDVQILSTAIAATGSVTVVDYSALSGVTVTVGSTVLTEGVDWTAAVSNDATATSLASAIDALALVSATSSAAVVNIVAVDPGAAGNSIALASSDAVNLTLSGASLSGGQDGDADLSDVVPGMIITDLSASFRAVIVSVNDTLDTITVATDPSSAFSPGDDVLVKLPSAVTYKELVINNPSRVAAWYFNRVVVLDESSSAAPGDVLIVDPIGHVAGVISRIDANTSIGAHSHAPAGIRYASLAGIQGLSLSLSERVDAEPLRLNFINRITSFPGSGNIIFGGYTAESGTSPLYTADEQLIQVMRTLQYVKASLEPGLRSFIWENFSPDTQLQVAAAIEAFMRNNIHLFPVGLPESQKFRVISVDPTQDDLDRGLLKVRVQVRPNKAVRFIEISLEFPIPSA